MSRSVRQHPKKHLIPKEVDVLTEKQKGEYKEAYDLFRRNRKGIYAGEDLKWVLNCMEFNPSNEDLNDFCEGAANEGIIYWEGFLKIIVEILKSSDKDYQFREAFMAFDTENTGSINRDKLKIIMLTIMPGQYTEQEVDDLIDRADEDGDGEIDFDEFVTMMKEQAQGDDD